MIKLLIFMRSALFAINKSLAQVPSHKKAFEDSLFLNSNSDYIKIRGSGSDKPTTPLYIINSGDCGHKCVYTASNVFDIGFIAIVLQFRNKYYDLVKSSVLKSLQGNKSEIYSANTSAFSIYIKTKEKIDTVVVYSLKFFKDLHYKLERQSILGFTWLNDDLNNFIK